MARAGLRKKRRRLADVPPSLSQYPADTSISVVAQHFPAEIDKTAFFEFFGHPRRLTLEQGEFLLLRRLEELEFALSEIYMSQMSHVM